MVRLFHYYFCFIGLFVCSQKRGVNWFWKGGSVEQGRYRPDRQSKEGEIVE